MIYVPDTTIKEMFWTGESRINRLRYFKRELALCGFFFVTFFAICIALMITSGFEVIDQETLLNHPAILISIAVLQIFSAVVSYKLDVRRLKDLGKGKMLAVIALVAGILGSTIWPLSLINVGVGLYLLCAPGNKGDNMYGADPLGNSNPNSNIS